MTHILLRAPAHLPVAATLQFQPPRHHLPAAHTARNTFFLTTRDSCILGRRLCRDASSSAALIMDARRAIAHIGLAARSARCRAAVTGDAHGAWCLPHCNVLWCTPAHHAIHPGKYSVEATPLFLLVIAPGLTDSFFDVATFWGPEKRIWNAHVCRPAANVCVEVATGEPELNAGLPP
jgi:hypothetical protein